MEGAGRPKGPLVAGTANGSRPPPRTPRPAGGEARSDPPGAPAGRQNNPAQAAESAPAVHDGSRDFDFEFGEWKIRLSRLARPLSGSTEWIEYEGTSVVRTVWNGRANLGELEVEGPDGRIQGLSLRLYDPASGQWRIHWANSRDGALGEAMVGGFRDGIGEFYNQEDFDGRSIFVRFLFTEITPTSFRLEQAFSADGGKTWEVNWIARFDKR
ncbi:MAG TPA: hypothetical protein VLF66_07850 [Thermoanaerobaculia bacterium]|nr:hypothetical protein [Thermoanaerobaculia bacterium]